MKKGEEKMLTPYRSSFLTTHRGIYALRAAALALVVIAMAGCAKKESAPTSSATGSTTSAAPAKTSIDSITKSAKEMERNASAMQKNFDANAKATSKMLESEASCIDSGKSYLTCYKSAK
ncbi:hypothetical protein ACSSZE_09380 [Acidithiobacillus caldus]